MKYLLTILLCLIATTAMAKSVTLSWDASPTEGVTGYTVHYGINETQPFPTDLDAGLVLTIQIPNLEDGVGYYFAVSAYNAAGMESTYSNVVYSPGFAPPTPPSGLSGITTVNNIDIPIK